MAEARASEAARARGVRVWIQVEGKASAAEDRTESGREARQEGRVDISNGLPRVAEVRAVVARHLESHDSGPVRGCDTAHFLVRREQRRDHLIAEPTECPQSSQVKARHHQDGAPASRDCLGTHVRHHHGGLVPKGHRRGQLKSALKARVVRGHIQCHLGPEGRDALRLGCVTSDSRRHALDTRSRHKDGPRDLGSEAAVEPLGVLKVEPGHGHLGSAAHGAVGGEDREHHR
mmetsp:Transcript_9505/g.21584  ORF Transcript_9505/g.21584 Transcript_9505/m.21584 type:complete len:232 (-) Transcript_9505:1378-2073(-)